MNKTIDWEYKQRYNERGEFNPRLIACETCGEYQEPEEMTKIDGFSGRFVCEICWVTK